MNIQKGFSIVELLIAVLIGLISIAATTTAMQRFENHHRSAVGTSESMQNGFLALFAIESDAAKAGWGLNDPWLLGCPTIMLDSFLPGGSTGYPLGSGGQPQPLVPATILTTGSSTPDTISFYSGASNTGTGVISISGASYLGDAGPISVSMPTPTFLPGDLYVVAPPATQVGRTCLIGQVSSMIIGNPNQILHAAGAIADTAATTRYNVATVGATYAQDAKVFNLGPGDSMLNRGPTPTFRMWFVQNGNLMIRASDVVTGNQVADTLVVDNIVSLKAQYGIPIGGVMTWSSTIIDADGDGTIGSPGDWQSVTAVRIAVVARSRQVDKPGANGTCTTTTAAPRVFNQGGSGFSVDVVIPGDTMDWTCYRYRVFETVVPMRNTIWRPT